MKEIDKWLEARSEVSAVLAEGGVAKLRELINSMKDVPDKTRLRLEGRRLLFQETGRTVWDRIGLAREYGRSGEHDQALGLYREAAGQGNPDARAAATVGAAAVFRRMDQPKRTEELCRQVLRSYPKDAFALVRWGSHYGTSGGMTRPKRLSEQQSARAAGRPDQSLEGQLLGRNRPNPGVGFELPRPSDNAALEDLLDDLEIDLDRGERGEIGRQPQHEEEVARAVHPSGFVAPSIIAVFEGLTGLEGRPW